jgi:uncharacterized membrane protein YraQ (UPF0718 family)
MKKKIIKDYFWVILFLIFSMGSVVGHYVPGQKIYQNFSSFFIELVSFLPLMFILVGLFDVWIPKEKIEKHIGHNSGIAGSFWVILLAMLQAGPLYASFPVAYILSKKGASVRNVFIYLGAFSAMKLPMLTFEVSFVGWKFALLRFVFTVPLFIIIGILMEKFLGRDYRVKKVAE